MVPGLEHHIGGNGPQMLEEPVPRAPRDDGLAPGQHGQRGGGMEGEGEQIEDHQEGSESFPAVPEIVFEIVTVGLQYVEGLVLDPRVKTSCPYPALKGVTRLVMCR